MPARRADFIQRLDRCEESLDRLVAVVHELPDSAITQPSHLPGWTRGHVLTHIARNADGMVNLAEWAATGEPNPMYPSREERELGIEAGARRPSKEIAEDLYASGQRYAHAWRVVADLDDVAFGQALNRSMHLGAPSPQSPVVTGATAPLSRRREVELHGVDLGLPDVIAAEWPSDFPGELLTTIAPTRASADGLVGVARLVDDHGTAWSLTEGTHGLTLQGPTWALALWLTGRTDHNAHLIAIDDRGASVDVPEAPAWV